ncbi:MAG: hypothetical protein K8R99_02895 [Actinomycetia bacterium]|nr:hypothetical protein [Actinomycetes bacterium]
MKGKQVKLSQRIGRRIKLAGFVLPITLVSCGNDDAALPGQTATPAVTVPGATAPAVPDTVASSSGSVAADDSCHVDITGDVTASFDSPGGFSNISYGPWVPNTSGTVMGIALDDTFFIMNCQGPDDQLVTISLGLDQHLPMAPATFPIRKADNIFGGYDSNPPVIQVSPYIGSGDFFWAVSADSVFTITEFDAEHIAGNFQFYVSEAKNDIVTDSLPAKTAVITGTFNLKNPN